MGRISPSKQAALCARKAPHPSENLIKEANLLMLGKVAVAGRGARQCERIRALTAFVGCRSAHAHAGVRRFDAAHDRLGVRFLRHPRPRSRRARSIADRGAGRIGDRLSWRRFDPAARRDRARPYDGGKSMHTVNADVQRATMRPQKPTQTFFVARCGAGGFPTLPLRLQSRLAALFIIDLCPIPP
jgi:hypothetical protein